MEAYVKRTANVRLARVDIVRWGSPVAKQYKIGSIPHLMLFEDGKLVAEGAQQVLSRLQ